MLFVLQILLFIVAAIVVFRIGRYLSTPLLKRLGFYKYYSPMFCTMPFFNNHLDIHLGTSWDFFKPYKLNSRIILLYLAEGLYSLSSAIERGEIDSQKILRGNVYYLNTSTFEKFGFRSRKLNLLEFVLFLMNYVELCILQSVSSGKVSVVSFKNLSILTCKAGDLPAYTGKLESLIKHLKRDELIVSKQSKTRKAALKQPERELVFND